MNYLAPSPSELVRNWDVSFADEWQPEVYPGDRVPIIRRRVAGYAGPREVVMARFGLLPSTSKVEKAAGTNVNLRSEVASTRPGTRAAYLERQWCIIPARSFFVPYLEAGSTDAERWSVQRTDGTPLSIAGIWDRWVSAAGREIVSFAMLTVNCDLHPLLQRFSNGRVVGKPDAHGKRTPVLLADEDFDAWLDTPPGRAPYFFGTFGPGDITATPAPASWRDSTVATSIDSTLSGY